MSDVGIRGSLLTCVAKTKALISYAVTTLLICIFVFTHNSSMFTKRKVWKPEGEAWGLRAFILGFIIKPTFN